LKVGIKVAETAIKIYFLIYKLLLQVGMLFKNI